MLGIFRVSAALFVIASFSAQVRAAEKPALSELGSIVAKNAPDDVVVTLAGTKAPDFTSYTMTSPFRVVVDWSGSKLVGVPEEKRFERGLVRRITARQVDAEGEKISRITIELAKETAYHVVAEGKRVLVHFVPVPEAVLDAEAALAAAPKTDANAKGDEPLTEPDVVVPSTVPPLPAKTDASKTTVAKPEPAKTEPAKTELAAVARTDAAAGVTDLAPVPGTSAAKTIDLAPIARTSDPAAKKGDAKPEAARADAEKAALAKAEAAKAEAAKAEAARIEAEKAALAKAEAAKAEAARIEAEKAALAKAEAAKAEAAKAEAAKAEAAKAEAARIEAEKAALAKAEAERAERAKAEAAKAEPVRLASFSGDAQSASASQPAEAQKPAEPQRFASLVPSSRERASEVSKWQPPSLPVPDKKLPVVRYASAQEGQKLQPSAKLPADPDEPAEPEGGQTDAKDAAEIDPGPRVMKYIGFQQMAEVSRVFVRLDGKAKYTPIEQGGAFVLELANTSINVKNNERALDTSYFDTPVKSVQAVRSGDATRIEVKLKESVPYKVSRIGNTIAIDFKRAK
ncbi:AMIN domain-containing protein [Myxococcota bacterium]|nr:AMIN domain-containing protein [Myxococcota bacterium]